MTDHDRAEFAHAFAAVRADLPPRAAIARRAAVGLRAALPAIVAV